MSESPRKRDTRGSVRDKKEKKEKPTVNTAFTKGKKEESSSESEAEDKRKGATRTPSARSHDKTRPSPRAIIGEGRSRAADSSSSSGGDSARKEKKEKKKSPSKKTTSTTSEQVPSEAVVRSIAVAADAPLDGEEALFAQQKEALLLLLEARMLLTKMVRWRWIKEQNEVEERRKKTQEEKKKKGKLSVTEIQSVLKSQPDGDDGDWTTGTPYSRWAFHGNGSPHSA